MKMSFVPKFGITILLLMSSIFVWAVIDNGRYYYPSPERKSAFIQNYSPDVIFDAFARNDFNRSAAGSYGSTAGTEFVTNDYQKDPTLVIDWDQHGSLMAELHHEMITQLEHSHAELLSESGDTKNGFHFVYKTGNIVGVAKIQLLIAKGESLSNSPLPERLQAVTPRISISEKWFPRESAALQTIAKSD